MAIYYHVSTELKHNGIFVPRIPDIRHKEEENVTISRVSVAPTIADCLTAIPNGGGRLDELNMMQRGYYLIFKVDTEKLGIEEHDMVSSKELYEKDLVRDADLTHEVWIIKAFEVPVEDRFILSLTEWQENPFDVFPFSIYEVAEREYEGDIHEAYADIYKEFVPCSVGITDIEYSGEIVEKGTELTLYTEEDCEEKKLLEFIQEHYKVENLRANFGEISFIVKENSNLNNLYLYHRDLIDV